MQQTFLNFVMTDLRFAMSSNMAVMRSLALPASLVAFGFWFVGGWESVLVVLFAAMVWSLFDWAFLVVRMARRIALGTEDPNALLDRSVFGNASHLYRSYYVSAFPSLRTA